MTSEPLLDAGKTTDHERLVPLGSTADPEPAPPPTASGKGGVEEKAQRRSKSAQTRPATPYHPLRAGLARLPRLATAAQRIARANTGRLAAPFKMTWAVTYWCQYRCATCNIWQKKPSDELSTEEVLRFIAENRSPSWLDVTGGEIFLRRDIETILTTALERWHDLALFHFATNGYKTDSTVAIVERLIGRAPAHLVITVSLDGPEELNDRIRGVPGGYRRQIETFKRLRALPGVRTFLGMTLSRDNVGQLDRTIEAVRTDVSDLSADDVHLNVMQLSDHYYSNQDTEDLVPDRGAVLAELARYRKRRGGGRSPAAWLENRYLGHLEEFLETGKTPIRCHSLRSSVFIDPWGTVFPCITWDESIGSLRDHDMKLEPIWRSAEARKRQADAWGGRCPQCWTACEAYPSIAGTALRPTHRRPPT